MRKLRAAADGRSRNCGRTLGPMRQTGTEAVATWPAQARQQTLEFERAGQQDDFLNAERRKPGNAL